VTDLTLKKKAFMAKSVTLTKSQIQDLLDEKHLCFDHPDFIQDDPISIPHQYSLPQDIEISGLFAAILAWGQRKTIINKCNELFNKMDNSPFDFILNHSARELNNLRTFKHRTFNGDDLLFLLSFLKDWYTKNDSLQHAFAGNNQKARLINFHNKIFEGHTPIRTQKHIATPSRKSACKRLNMYLRWMVRTNSEVDFGLWTNIPLSQLHCPLDVHVERVAKGLGLLHRKQSDWIAVEELMRSLIKFDPIDPVKYDFALFGLGLEEKYDYVIGA
jgi:uncharacterized protein (TIGR02757 family)